MKSPLSKLISRGETTIYRLLRRGRSQTAKQIGTKLHILPNAVYRSIENLRALGLVYKTGHYPTQFAARETPDALESYLAVLRENFMSAFPTEGVPPHDLKDSLDVSFVRNRTELLKKTDHDLMQTKVEAHLIVSGLEVPAETVLKYKHAVDRGVTVRILVQNLNEANKEMLHNWQRNGVDVRHYHVLEARIFIFDAQVVYITSYDPQEKEVGTGVRLNNPAIARVMNDTFRQRWDAAEIL